MRSMRSGVAVSLGGISAVQSGGQPDSDEDLRFLGGGGSKRGGSGYCRRERILDFGNC